LPFSFLGHEGQDVYLGFPRASAIAARVPGLFSILTVNSFILAMADLLERKTSDKIGISFLSLFHVPPGVGVRIIAAIPSQPF
jgi:hypothetical protein